MLTVRADSTLTTKTRSYKEFYIRSTSNASHISRFTLVNARIDTRLYIFISIARFARRGKEGICLIPSPSLAFYYPHILPGLLMMKDNERWCIHPGIPYSTSDTFLSFESFSKSNEEFKRNELINYFAIEFFGIG